MSHVSGIYEIRNTENGSRYIGSATRLLTRWGAHRSALKRGDHHNAHLQHAWNKYGESAFQFSPLMFCLSGGEQELREWEQRYTDEFKPDYNIAIDTVCPMRGRRHSDETRAKFTLAMLGNTRSAGCKRSDEFKERVGLRTAGRRHSAELKQRMSDGRRGKGTDPRGPMPLLQRKSISDAAIGRTHTDVSKAKVSASLKGNTRALGKRRTEEQKAQIALLKALNREIVAGATHGLPNQH